MFALDPILLALVAFVVIFLGGVIAVSAWRLRQGRPSVFASSEPEGTTPAYRLDPADVRSPDDPPRR